MSIAEIQRYTRLPDPPTIAAPARVSGATQTCSLEHKTNEHMCTKCPPPVGRGKKCPTQFSDGPTAMPTTTPPITIQLRSPP